MKAKRDAQPPRGGDRRRGQSDAFPETGASSSRADRRAPHPSADRESYRAGP